MKKNANEQKGMVCLNKKCVEGRYIEDLRHLPMHREHASDVFLMQELREKMIESDIHLHTENFNALLSQKT
jgi:hypothetical protein